jgi:hypothetical protein
MNLNQITNDNIRTIDWAEKDRAAFLRSVPRAKKCTDVQIAPGILASDLWMRDISAADPRSVKAHLAGGGDWRVRWWNFNCFVHRLLWPRAPLENIMYAFHKLHLTLTFIRLQFFADWRQLAFALRDGGVTAGLKCMWEQLTRNIEEQEVQR